MTTRAYYATHNAGPYEEHQVILFDGDKQVDAGWIDSGYFKEIKAPEPRHDAEEPNRAG
jgi:hypothetical protein